MADFERRRRRLQHSPPAAPPETDQSPPEGRPVPTADAPDPKQEQLGRRRGPGPGAEDRETERGLRGLVGSGSSQVSIGAALRARDAARPADADLAEAEKRLVVVRRNWVPRDGVPHGRQDPSSSSAPRPGQGS
jgi:hypothetical protein